MGARNCVLRPRHGNGGMPTLSMQGHQREPAAQGNRTLFNAQHARSSLRRKDLMPSIARPSAEENLETISRLTPTNASTAKSSSRALEKIRRIAQQNACTLARGVELRLPAPERLAAVSLKRCRMKSSRAGRFAAGNARTLKSRGAITRNATNCSGLTIAGLTRGRESENTVVRSAIKITAGEQTGHAGNAAARSAETLPITHWRHRCASGAKCSESLLTLRARGPQCLIATVGYARSAT